MICGITIKSTAVIDACRFCAAGFFCLRIKRLRSLYLDNKYLYVIIIIKYRGNVKEYVTFYS